MNLRIGTAGYAYPAWVGGFYPPGTASGAMLGYYATQFPVVEINSSFHRPPTVAQAEDGPAGAGRVRVHPEGAAERQPRRRLGELPAFRGAAGELARQGKLLGLVVQFAESFRNEPGNRDHLLRVRERLAESRWPSSSGTGRGTSRAPDGGPAVTG